MRAVVQRVARASVIVGEETVGDIGTGLLVLLGVGHDDGEAEGRALVDKLLGLRIFPDDEQRMNQSVVDVGGSVLVVSQFTLAAQTSRGNRPSFVNAEEPERAEQMYEEFLSRLSSLGINVGSGAFGKMMKVGLVNDGPVTIMLDSHRIIGVLYSKVQLIYQQAIHPFGQTQKV